MVIFEVIRILELRNLRKRGVKGPCYPDPEWMEQELVASVRILLPTVQFIVHRQGHTFFEAITRVGAEANYITGDLQT